MIRIARFAKVAVWGIVFGWVFLGSAQAAIVQVDNPSVNYILEYDDTLLGLYGAPTISVTGNVEYTPSEDFRAASGFGFCSTPFTGSPFCNVGSELNLTLIARSGFAFDSISLTEGGAYMKKGASASVGVGGLMDVFEGGTIGGEYAFGSIIAGTTFVADNIFHPWTASAFADLTGSNWNGINTIDIVVDNSLTAFTAPSSSDEAEIQKEYVAAGVSLGIDMNGGAGGAVPVPAAVWLFASGLFGLVGVARRKGRQSA